MQPLQHHIQSELDIADKHCSTGDLSSAFHHLERAHVLGQASTFDHTKIHWRMFKLGWKMRSFGEVWGQVIRMVGAASKTPLGLYPTGNTGEANVWFFKPMPVPDDLKRTLDKNL